MSIHYWYHVHNHEDRRGQVMICQCWVTQCHSPFKANVPETEVFFNQLHVLQPLSQWVVNNFFKLKMDFQNPECIGHKKDKRWEFIMILQLMNKPTTYFRTDHYWLWPNQTQVKKHGMWTGVRHQTEKKKHYMRKITF